jgi:hypothetical protein
MERIVYTNWTELMVKGEMVVPGSADIPRQTELAQEHITQAENHRDIIKQSTEQEHK